MATAPQAITLAEIEEMSSEDLAERFKDTDLELCVEPLSEWGSELETLLQKLEKGVMQWYATGIKRSFTICFKEEAEETTKAASKAEDAEAQEVRPAVLTTPAIAS
jgi:hypothetical protein